MLSDAALLQLSRQAPIGVFDSGVGGLTVLRALRLALPHERFVYELTRPGREVRIEFDLEHPIPAPPPPWSVAPKPKPKQ